MGTSSAAGWSLSRASLLLRLQARAGSRWQAQGRPRWLRVHELQQPPPQGRGDNQARLGRQPRRPPQPPQLLKGSSESSAGPERRAGAQLPTWKELRSWAGAGLGVLCPCGRTLDSVPSAATLTPPSPGALTWHNALWLGQLRGGTRRAPQLQLYSHRTTCSSALLAGGMTGDQLRLGRVEGQEEGAFPAGQNDGWTVEGSGGGTKELCSSERSPEEATPTSRLAAFSFFRCRSVFFSPAATCGTLGAEAESAAGGCSSGGSPSFATLACPPSSPESSSRSPSHCSRNTVSCRHRRRGLRGHVHKDARPGHGFGPRHARARHPL